MNKYEASQERDASIAIASTLGYDISGLPLWGRDPETGFSVLTLNGALEIAKTFGIKFEVVSCSRYRAPNDAEMGFYALVRARLGKRAMVGGAWHKLPDVAELLAKRNAVRLICQGQNGRAVQWFCKKADIDERWGSEPEPFEMSHADNLEVI